MTPSLANAFPMSPWRRAGASLALVASLAFALQPNLLLAQAVGADNPPPAKVQPKPHKPKAAKKASHTSPTDNVSDDLNRREAERAAGVVRQMTQAASTQGASGAPVAATPPAPASPVQAQQTVLSPAAAATLAVAPPGEVVNPVATEPPTVAAIPPRPPVVSASLTPTISTQQAVERPMAVVAAPSEPSTPKIQEAQARPPAPGPAPAPTPAPVPIQPPVAGVPPGSPAVAGAPTRSFAQSQLVPTQQPTLHLEVNKGTAIKLPGPATTVFVAAPDIADVQVKSPGMIYVFAKKPGDTVLYAVDDQDRVLLNTIVSVSSPFSRMKATLDQQYPGNGVSFDNQNDAIVLNGTVRAAVIAEDARKIAVQYTGSNAKIINNIKIEAPTQVQLRVKVAEVNRGSLKRVGINWQNINNIALLSIGGAGFGFATSTITATGGQVPGSAQVIGQNTLSNPSLSNIVDLLATQNQATILAEPNLVAMSGETANFLAGEEIPVIQPQAGGITNVITVAYKQVGVSIAFTPTIIGERINLKVAPEVSQITTQGQVSVPITNTATVVIPAIETRKANTTVELGSGQSFAIAGLLNHTSQQDITKVPWLGDMPILGALFKSDAYQRNETELVIIVTPYFVEPVSTQLRTPLTARVGPTDQDRLLYGRFNHPTPPDRISVGREPQYAGPSAGFKLD